MSTRIALVIVLSIVVSGCLRAPTPAQSAAAATEVASKANEDETCLVHSRTCSEYVACRARVAARYRVIFTGRCEQ